MNLKKEIKELQNLFSWKELYQKSFQQSKVEETEKQIIKKQKRIEKLKNANRGGRY